jgi:hypothetical protein
MSDSLEARAARACADPWCLGWVLAAYQRWHGLTDEALARELGCNDVAVLSLLRLCRRPGLAAPERMGEEDIEEIAQRFAVDAAALRRVFMEIR